MSFTSPLKESLKKLTRWPIEPATFREAILEANEAELDAMVRLFVTEAPAIVFQQFPLAYEYMRHFVAGRLFIDPKDVCLTGSSRVGFAMPCKPSSDSDKIWGRKLAEHSDLDLFAVNPKLFQRCVEDVEYVELDKAISHKATEAERQLERERWREKAHNVRRCLERGFFDTRHMPEGKSAPPTTKGIESAMGALHRSWQRFGYQPLAKKRPSLRVYKSWKHARGQLGINLRAAARAHLS